VINAVPHLIERVDALRLEIARRATLRIQSELGKAHAAIPAVKRARVARRTLQLAGRHASSASNRERFLTLC
jgi:hypothetical protein